MSRVSSPDLEPDYTPPEFVAPYDTQVFAPHNLSLTLRTYRWDSSNLQPEAANCLYSPFFVVRPITESERTIFLHYRDLIRKEMENFDQMGALRVTPEGKLGPYPQDSVTQMRVVELERIEAAIDSEKSAVAAALCKTYWVSRLHEMPILLRNADRPHGLKRFVLYDRSLWSSMHSFADCAWALIVKVQDRIDFYKPVEAESFLNVEKNDLLQHAGANDREPLPEHVRFAVWRRDQGRCAKCGSRQRLEFDHIIPVSLGGGNTARNVELLCEACNRAKGAKV